MNLLAILNQHKSVIKEISVKKYEVRESAYAVVLKINFKDKSELHVRDYLFDDGMRSYSYHWQDKGKKCLFRWDNTPHHPKVKTFPHHVHVGKIERVKESEPQNLERVLTKIVGLMK